MAGEGRPPPALWTCLGAGRKEPCIMFGYGDVESLACERMATMQRWAERERLIALARQQPAASVRPGGTRSAARPAMHAPRVLRPAPVRPCGILLRLLSALFGSARPIRVS